MRNHIKPDEVVASIIATTRVTRTLGSNGFTRGFTLEKMAMKTLRKFTVIALGMVSAMLFAAQALAQPARPHAQEITELILAAAGR